MLHNPLYCSTNHVMTLELRDKGDRGRCYHRGCREEKGLRVGTWLAGSKLTYRKIILFIYCWSRELTTIKFSDHELNIGKTSVIELTVICEKCALLTSWLTLTGNWWEPIQPKEEQSRPCFSCTLGFRWDLPWNWRKFHVCSSRSKRSSTITNFSMYQFGQERPPPPTPTHPDIFYTKNIFLKILVAGEQHTSTADFTSFFDYYCFQGKGSEVRAKPF